MHDAPGKSAYVTGSLRQAPRCPICDRPSVPTSRPFCGPRCADVDLGRWLTSQYVVPGAPAELEDGGPSSEAED